VTDFLGDLIVSNPEISSKKVPDMLREECDAPISLGELDAALKTMKNGSAGGPDGLSVKFVKKFWHFFRVPLKKYADYCTVNGTITDSFATASIKLIPKKGDLSKIKNWRPISLLNVLYKIIAKALNNRLKKIAPLVLSRSQKGFVDKKFIQECLINIGETINYAERNKIKAFCLALDMAKAFDSVNHALLTDVYKFFGFGNTLIKMLNTFTTGRHANILFDDGSKGQNFLLECGNAQGNPPSPLQFNFCEEILLIKLEYGRLIKSIISPRIREMDAGEEDQNRDRALDIEEEEPGTINVIGKNDKVEAFADDGTVLGRLEPDTLQNITNTLLAFSQISGLSCNMEKSSLLILGYADNEPVPDWVANSGFKVENELQILGCKITKNVPDWHVNFDKTIATVCKIKNFWERFQLSLPGRIGIAKALMLSQISYLGCFLTPTKKQFNDLNSLITSFFKGNLNISKKKNILSPEDGGVGMIAVEPYVRSLQCGWFKRIFNGSPDSYKEILFKL
jgi:hypothetical protein